MVLIIAPLLHAQVHQVSHTRPLDEGEQGGGGGHQRAQAHPDQQHLGPDAEDQPGGGPVTALKTMLQAAAHGGHGAGARAQADGPGGGEKGDPEVQFHGGQC
jgi:hypothetical protein